MIISNLSFAFLPNQFRVNFVQKFESAVTGKTKQSKGIIEYQYPGKIHFKSEDPDPLTYMSNNKKSWYYTPPFIEGEKGEVRIIEKNSTLTSFFDTLKKGIKSNDFYKVKRKGSRYDLIFSTEKSKELGVQAASLFSKYLELRKFDHIQKIYLTYNSGKKVNLIFTDYSKPSFKKKHFYFKIPSNTRVIN